MNFDLKHRHEYNWIINLKFDYAICGKVYLLNLQKIKFLKNKRMFR